MMSSLTTGTFFNGRIRVYQDRSGYRFSIDAVLLAYHARPRPGDIIIDLGTGCGIIPLIMAYRNPDINIFGVEIQKELADIAALNVEKNDMSGCITILCQDMKRLKHDAVSGPVDLVLSNPPYRKTRSGRINPDQQRAVARHELEITLYDVVTTAYRMLKVSGKFLTIYPAERMTDIITEMRSVGIEPKSLRIIYSYRDSEAKLIFLEGIKGGRPGLKIAPPLIIYNKNGSYTEKIKKMFLP